MKRIRIAILILVPVALMIYWLKPVVMRTHKNPTAYYAPESGGYVLGIRFPNK